MKTHLRAISHALAAVLTEGAPGAGADEVPAPVKPRAEVLTTPDGARTPGRLTTDAPGGFGFLADGSSRPRALEPGMAVEFGGVGPSPAAGSPPFRVELGTGQRLSGRLSAVNAREVRLTDTTGRGALTVARGGVQAVVQRPGETQVFEDQFESLDTTRWTVVGEPEVADGLRAAGAHSLKIPAGGASLTHRLEQPFGSGRLEVAFHDDGALAAGQQWFVDLTFRSPSGRQTARAVLGWAEESLAVESPGGPAMAVQRLSRKPGWPRLSVRFGPDGSEVAVDGNELAHGKGFGGPLVEVRLASYVTGKAADAEPPAELAGYLDDLRLVRSAEPASGLEIDATQDEVRLTGGDQLFGKLLGADGERVELTIDGNQTALPWGDVSGLYFRRDSAPGAPVEGLLVRLEWRAAPGNDPRDLNRVEGALMGATPSALALATPYAGVLTIPRERLTALRVVGRGRRIVIDPMAHHLGDEISATPPLLDPPQPEGGTLERAVELPAVPGGAAHLVLDVVQVVGEAADLPFSNLVKKGELRTVVKINGEPFDYLNRHISTRNEELERIRLPIPDGLLRPGKNVIRFEQAGAANDPNYLDDLGVLGIALEFDTGGGGAVPR